MLDSAITNPSSMQPSLGQAEPTSKRIRYWMKGEQRQNFGDFLSELFVEEIFSEQLRISADIYRLIGSVIDESVIDDDLKRINKCSAGKIAFWCCGARDDVKLSKDSLDHSLFFGVRGPLTRDILGLPQNTVLGDPAFLLPLIYQPKESAHTCGKTICIPHIFDQKDDATLQAQSGADIVIRPTVENTIEALLRLLDDIVSAKFVLTGSLHAAIVACAYNVPFCYWDNGHLDVPFKWRDLSASLNILPCFADNIDDGLHIYETLLRKRIRKPLSLPILAVAPFHVRSEVLYAAAMGDAAALRDSNVDVEALRLFFSEIDLVNQLAHRDERLANVTLQFDGLVSQRDNALSQCAEIISQRDAAISRHEQLAHELDSRRGEIERLQTSLADRDRQLEEATQELDRVRSSLGGRIAGRFNLLK